MRRCLAGLRSGCSMQDSKKQTLWACSTGLRNGVPGVGFAQADCVRGNLAKEEQECQSFLVLAMHYESDAKKVDSWLSAVSAHLHLSYRPQTPLSEPWRSASGSGLSSGCPKSSSITGGPVGSCSHLSPLWQAAASTHSKQLCQSSSRSSWCPRSFPQHRLCTS